MHSQEAYSIAAIASLVEGLTEFLPISSTLHVKCVAFLVTLGLADTSAGLSVVDDSLLYSQFGAISAIIFHYRSDVLALIKVFVMDMIGLSRYWPKLDNVLYIRSDTILNSDRQTVVSLAIALCVTAVLGSVVSNYVGYHDDLMTAKIALLAFTGFGALLLAINITSKDNVEKKNINWWRSLIIACAQIITLFSSGVSRSGITITAALAAGIDRKQAVCFSFLLGVLTIYPYTVMKIIKHGVSDYGIALMSTAIGFATAMATGNAILNFISTRRGLTITGLYRMIAGFILIVLFFIVAGSIH